MAKIKALHTRSRRYNVTTAIASLMKIFDCNCFFKFVSLCM